MKFRQYQQVNLKNTTPQMKIKSCLQSGKSQSSSSYQPTFFSDRFFFPIQPASVCMLDLVLCVQSRSSHKINKEFARLRAIGKPLGRVTSS